MIWFILFSKTNIHLQSMLLFKLSLFFFVFFVFYSSTCESVENLLIRDDGDIFRLGSLVLFVKCLIMAPNISFKFNMHTVWPVLTPYIRDLPAEAFMMEGQNQRRGFLSLWFRAEMLEGVLMMTQGVLIPT